MGWNQGYTIFEATVIGAYDIGKLDRELLTVLLEPYRGTDIDSGGTRDLKTTDGKDVTRVVIETMGREYPPRPETTDEDKLDLYYVSIYDMFNEITLGQFGWG